MYQQHHRQLQRELVRGRLQCAVNTIAHCSVNVSLKVGRPSSCSLDVLFNDIVLASVRYPPDMLQCSWRIAQSRCSLIHRLR